MKRIIPEKVSGYRSEVLNGLIDCVIALWPTESATIISNVTSRGTDHEVKRNASSVSASSETKKPFDLADKLTATFSVMDRQGKSNGVTILGVKKVVAAGTGFTWDGGLKWTCAAISASTYVYIVLNRTDATATLTQGATFPDGTDPLENHSLWYIPWVDASGSVAAHIDWANAIDMRAGIRLPGMA